MAEDKKKSTKAPRPKVDTSSKTKSAKSKKDSEKNLKTPKSQAAAAEQGKAEAKEAKRQTFSLLGRLVGFFEELVPGQGYAILFGLLAIILAVAIITIGFFRCLIIAIALFIGVMIGQYFDGNPRIINWFRRRFRKK